jgi:hypothetical protein
MASIANSICAYDDQGFEICAYVKWMIIWDTRFISLGSWAPPPLLKRLWRSPDFKLHPNSRGQNVSIRHNASFTCRVFGAMSAPNELILTKSTKVGMIAKMY